MSRYLTVAAIGLAIALSVGAASTAEAKAGHAQPGPDVLDQSAAVSHSSTQAAAAEAPTCYVEPDGFHFNIRWDSACVKLRQQQAQRAGTTASGTATPDKFVAPRGFHSQIRWD